MQNSHLFIRNNINMVLCQAIDNFTDLFAILIKLDTKSGNTC